MSFILYYIGFALLTAGKRGLWMYYNYTKSNDKIVRASSISRFFIRGETNSLLMAELHRWI